VKKCSKKYPALPNQRSQRSSDSGQKQNIGHRKYCKFCEKDSHTGEKKFALGKDKKRL
jgi:hypothetical protein